MLLVQEPKDLTVKQAQNVVVNLNRRLSTLQKNDLADTNIYENILTRVKKAGLDLGVGKDGQTIVRATKENIQEIMKKDSKTRDYVKSAYRIPSYQELTKRAKEYMDGVKLSKEKVNEIIKQVDTIHEIINDKKGVLYSHMNSASEEINILTRGGTRPTYEELNQVVAKIHELENSAPENSEISYFKNKAVRIDEE